MRVRLRDLPPPPDVVNAAWELNVGVGVGLTPSSVIVKAIFGQEIGRLWGHDPSRALPGGAPIAGARR